MVISYFPEDERKRSMPETEHGGNAVKLHLLYLQLLDHFEGARVAETTLRELAGVWSCTVRNAALVIGRMEALGWVRRQAERGRGRRSVMAFLAAEDEIAGDIIARAASGKDLLKLLKALEELGSAASGSGVRVRLEAELLSRLGFRSGRRPAPSIRWK
jgi:MarR-like DNA-binding transcriptional regulator SgrR of sgrS sRNA